MSDTMTAAPRSAPDAGMSDEPWWKREHTEQERITGVIRDLKMHDRKDTSRVCAQALNLIRDLLSERAPMTTPAATPPLARRGTTLDALDQACANVLLAFQDWPERVSPGVTEERTAALDALAIRLSEFRAAPAPVVPEEVRGLVDAWGTALQELAKHPQTYIGLFEKAQAADDARVALDASLSSLVAENARLREAANRVLRSRDGKAGPHEWDMEVLMRELRKAAARASQSSHPTEERQP